MSWLSKIEPVTLYQGSDLPYVVTEEGIKLCFDNSYCVDPVSSEFQIAFQVHKKKLMRQSANYFRFHDFPVVIPFDEVLNLNDTVIDGHILKHASSVDCEPLSIMLIKDAYISDLDNDALGDFVDLIENHDHSFVLLSEDNPSPQTRLLDDLVESIVHTDYGRTIVHIAHTVCPTKSRKYCWTKMVPDLSIHCYGLNDSEEKNDMDYYFEYIGIDNVETLWED